MHVKMFPAVHPAELFVQVWNLPIEKYQSFLKWALPNINAHHLFDYFFI
jgi:hypothetical protein